MVTIDNFKTLEGLTNHSDWQYGLQIFKNFDLIIDVFFLVKLGHKVIDGFL